MSKEIEKWIGARNKGRKVSYYDDEWKVLSKKKKAALLKEGPIIVWPRHWLPKPKKKK